MNLEKLLLLLEAGSTKRRPLLVKNFLKDVYYKIPASSREKRINAIVKFLEEGRKEGLKTDKAKGRDRVRSRAQPLSKHFEKEGSNYDLKILNIAKSIESKAHGETAHKKESIYQKYLKNSYNENLTKKENEANLTNWLQERLSQAKNKDLMTKKLHRDVKKFRKTEGVTKSFLNILDASSDKLKKDLGVAPRKYVSNQVFKNNKHLLNNEEEFAKKSAEDIYKKVSEEGAYHSFIETYKNVIRNNKKLPKDKKESLVRKISIEWRKLTEKEGTEFERSIKEINTKDGVVVKKTKGKINWFGDNVLKSTSKLSKDTLENESRDMVTKRKIIFKNIIKKIRGADFLKDDLDFDTGGTGKSPVRMELKNKAGLGNNQLEKLIKAMESGEDKNNPTTKLSISEIPWATFIIYNRNNIDKQIKKEADISGVKFNTSSKEINKLIKEVIDNNRKWLNNELNQHTKSAIFRIPDNDVKKYKLLIGDIRYKNNKYAILIDLKKDIKNIRFRVKNVEYLGGNEYIFIDVKNITINHLKETDQLIEEFSLYNKVTEDSLLLFKKLLIEGMNTSYI